MRFSILALFILLLSLSCEEALEFNPLDPENPDYIPPETTITSGPSEGAVLDISSAIFTWEGNNLVIDYSYKHDSNDWSEWADVTSVTLEYLDEGPHSFSVKGRYSETIEDETPASISFSVDAVQGSGLRIYPLLTEVTSGATFTVSLYAEEVSELTFGEVQISYNSSYATFVSVESSGLLTGNAEDVIFISEHTNGSSEGQIDLTFALTGEESLEGTGALCIFTFTASSPGSFPLSISAGSVFRDKANNNIPVHETANGLVVVE